MPQAGGIGIGRDSSEFGRVVGFSDAIFAIAMTLLVLQIEISGIGYFINRKMPADVMAYFSRY